MEVKPVSISSWKKKKKKKAKKKSAAHTQTLIQMCTVAVLVPLGDNTDSSYRQPLPQVSLWFAAEQLIRYTTRILVLPKCVANSDFE